jgi:hypothetical protein
MKRIISLLFFAAFMMALISVQAQKNNQQGVGMNKSENKLNVKAGDGTVKGIQVNTKSVEEIIGTAALCKYTVKLKDPSGFKEQGVCWGKSSGPDISGNKASLSAYAENVINGEMTGLEPNTAYFARAYVTTSAGTFYGNEISFKTIEGQGVSTYWIRRR